MIQKWFKNDLNMFQKWLQNDSKMIQTWFKNESKMIQKWFQNDPKMSPKWNQSESNMNPTWSQNLGNNSEWDAPPIPNFLFPLPWPSQHHLLTPSSPHPHPQNTSPHFIIADCPVSGGPHGVRKRVCFFSKENWLCIVFWPDTCLVVLTLFSSHDIV